MRFFGLIIVAEDPRAFRAWLDDITSMSSIEVLRCREAGPRMALEVIEIAREQLDQDIKTKIEERARQGAKP